MRKHGLIVAVSVLAILIPGLSAQAAPAGRAGAPGWRVTAVFGEAKAFTSLSTLTASSARNAWAGGVLCDRACYGHGPQHPSLLIEHFDGVQWTRLSAPSGEKGVTNGITSIGGTPSDLWATAESTVQTSQSQTTISYLLHRQHGQWGVRRFPDNTLVGNLVVFGPSDVWAFGVTPREQGFAMHFNGRTWRRFPLAVAPQAVSATSASDIWLIGEVPANKLPRPRKSDAIAERWNGKKWLKVAVPAVTAPPGFAGAAVGGTGVAAGPGEFWASISLGTSTGCCALGGLLHLKNGSWHKVAVPGFVKFGGPLALDGHGGIWLIGGSGNQFWLLHYQGGRWSRTPDPKVKGGVIAASSLTWIPHTTSVWATASLDPPSDSFGFSQAAVLKFGR
jgi:hypothetical protein